MATKAKKPLSVWKRPVKVSFKELFKGLSKAAINVGTLNWGSAAKDAVDTVSNTFGLSKKTPDEVAWLLVTKALIKACLDLINERQELACNLSINPEELSENLGRKMDDLDFEINADIFKSPASLPFLPNFQEHFCEWLQAFGIEKPRAATIADRLPTYFTFALDSEWVENSEAYEALKTINTPFMVAVQRERAWLTNQYKLQHNVDKPVFGEPFSLRQVYVWPRAYYEKKSQRHEDTIDSVPGKGARKVPVERMVVKLKDDLLAWLDSNNSSDTIRVISGDPGCGKSSFCKMFAAELSESRTRALLVPLHLVDLEKDLSSAIQIFLERTNTSIGNPFQEEDPGFPILLILDALDELSKEGRKAEDLVKSFIDHLIREVNLANHNRPPRIKALLSGREIVIHSHILEFKQPGGVLHFIPYFVQKEERSSYVDSQGLLEEDQRSAWWIKYGEAIGQDFSGMPKDPGIEKLESITAQPLLNYLVALSYVRKRIDFSREDNINRIYEDILDSVHERDWHDYHCQVQALKDITKDQYKRFLQDIAICVWHKDSLAASVDEIEKYCSDRSKNVLAALRQRAEKGVTQFLATFYFRQSEYIRGENPLFEFTHKTFREYLTAKTIVRLLSTIHNQLKAREENPDIGWDEKFSLVKFVELFGPSQLDDYLLTFVTNELKLGPEESLVKVRKTLRRLLEYSLRNSLPMEEIKGVDRWGTAIRWARNSEEALLVLLNSCTGLIPQAMTKINWPDQHKTAFKDLLFRLGRHPSFASRNLFSMDLKGCDLSFLSLGGAMMARSNLTSADLSFANLYGADLSESDLSHADLAFAHLADANLSEADLSHADLAFAHLSSADLSFANLSKADLSFANLSRAHLSSADLSFANLSKADLSDANLSKADLSKAYLSKADLSKVDLSGADLSGANLSEADLSGAEMSNTFVSENQLAQAIFPRFASLEEGDSESD